MVSGEHGSSDQMMVRQLWEELPDPQDPAQAQPRRGRGRGGHSEGTVREQSGKGEGLGGNSEGTVRGW